MILLGRNVPLVTLYQDSSSHRDSSKHIAGVGGVGRGAGLLYLVYLCKKL